METTKRYYSRGFTLIELLTVIAIIGILAGILIPTVGAVRTSANKAKTKAQFGQWTVAMAAFKQEYGYYPDVGNGTNKVDSVAFLAALTGRTYTGTPAGTLHGNSKRLSPYSVAESEITAISKGDAVDGLLKDAFGNTDIAVFRDTTNDGRVNADDAPALARVPVASVDSGGTVAPNSDTFDPAAGIHGGVIFYSAGKGRSASDIVTSW